jgi:hypothetical protein
LRYGAPGRPMICLSSLFSSTMTAIRDPRAVAVPEEEVVMLDDAGLGAGAADDRVLADSPPHPAVDTISSATVAIHVTP